ncbi:hypothetical protein SLA2020_392190 [Shorea laevis]
MPPKIVAVICIGVVVGIVGPDSDGLSINKQSFPAMSKKKKKKKPKAEDGDCRTEQKFSHLFHIPCHLLTISMFLQIDILSPKLLFIYSDDL